MPVRQQILTPFAPLANVTASQLSKMQPMPVGTYYKGRHIGAKGTAIFSFHAIKNITCAEGGLIVTDNENLARQLRMLKFHGLGVDAYYRQTWGRAPQAEV